MYTWLRAADQFTVPQQRPGGDKKKARERKTNKRLVGLLKEEMKGARAFLEGGGSQRALHFQTAVS